MPFEIPESWEWVRLQSVCTKLVDGDHNPPKGEVHRTNYIMASSTNINQDRLVDLEKVRYLSAEIFLRENERTAASEGDIFFTSVGSLGRSCIFDGSLNICFQRSVSVITTLLFNEYLKYCFDSGYFQNKVQKEATGTAQKGFYLNQLANALIPVPPYDEQVRIVSEIKKYLPLIVEYDNRQASLNELNNNFPEQLKKSILQMAVQGKLVSQDPSDEPASVLLERIRAEKERLIKEGKIKRDKNESFIFRRDNSHYEKRDGIEICIDDEIPFDVPTNWSWARTSSLGRMIRGKGIKRTETVPCGKPCIRYGEIYTTYNIEFCKAVSFIPDSLDKQCLHFAKGDIVYTLTGENKVDIAKAVAFLGDGQVAAGGDLAYWTAHGMNPLYLVYYMASPFCIEQKRRTATGDIIVHISTEKVGRFLIPVPPLAEQNRIVLAIQEAFDVIKTL